MELLPNEQIVWRGHPTARSEIGWYLKWGFLALLPVIIAGLLRAADRGTGLGYWTWIGISVALLVLVVVIDVLRRAATDYVITTQRIRIRRGIVSRREQSTVIEKVQNINTSQSLLDRMLGVGDVDFDTAGTEAREASFVFRGIDSPHSLVARMEQVRQSVRQQAAGG